ncbi:MAG: hypothetical protein HZA88_14175 [Verrucomicrobia bacterium]|nr:hypothetical protein [Verrucomicrobiota bacterium]
MKSRKVLIGIIVGIVLLIIIVLFGTSTPRSSPRKPASIQTNPAQKRVPLLSRRVASPESMPYVAVKLPTSVNDFKKRFIEGVKLADQQLRWQAWRELGINLSDKDFAAAEAQAEKEIVLKGASFPKGWSTSIRGMSRDENLRVLALQAAIFARWVEKDPQSAVTWAYGLEAFPREWGIGLYNTGAGFETTSFWNMGDQHALLSQMVSQWCAKDMNAASAWLESLPAGLGQNVARCGWVMALAVSSPESAFAALETIKYSREIGDLVQNTGLFLFRRWASANRPAMLAWIEANPMHDGRMDSIGETMKFRAVTVMAETLAREDIPSAIQWASSLPILTRGDAIGKIVDEWARKDFEAARQWVTNLWESEKGEKNHQMLYSIGREWVEKDPQAALEWISHLKDKYDPDNRVPSEGSRWQVNVTLSMASQWAKNDTAAAVAWSESLPEGELKNKVCDWIAVGLANTVAREASNFQELRTLVENLPKAVQEQVWIGTFGRWKSSDSTAQQEMADYLKALPEDYFQGLGAGRGRDNVFSQYITSVPPSREVLQLASEIKNERWRNQCIERAVKNWLVRDKGAATQWVQQASLPQELKDKLLRNGK